MEKVSYFLFLFIILYLQVFSQSTTTYESDANLCIGNGSLGQGDVISACEGENLTLLFGTANYSYSFGSTGCGGIQIINYVNECSECESISTPNISVNYSGGAVSYNVDYSNSAEIGKENCPTGESLTLNITPSQTATMTISWLTTTVSWHKYAGCMDFNKTIINHN